jgi:hypothetical protein
MRFFSGLIIGIALTFGGAYLHDVNIPAAAASDPGQAQPDAGPQRIVNWDVLGAITRQQSDFLRAQWNKIFR